MKPGAGGEVRRAFIPFALLRPVVTVNWAPWSATLLEFNFPLQTSADWPLPAYWISASLKTLKRGLHWSTQGRERSLSSEPRSLQSPWMLMTL